MSAERRSRCRGLACAVLATLALLAAAPGAAFDLSNITKGLLENADTIGKVLGNSDALFGNYSEEQERRLGRAAAAVLLGAAPAYRGEPVQRYVNTVGAWLARHTERPDLEWRFAVLDSPGINAFAAPGGYVFVTRGLLAVLRGEAELAGVLAHEMAHVLAFHHLEAMTSRERFQLATDLALKASDLDGMLSDALVSMTREIYAKGLEQGDEFEADVMGVVIAARAGYDPYGLTQVLRTIDAASGDAAATGFFISTHPPVGERLQRLDATLQREFEIPGPPPSGSFRRMQAALGAR